MSDSISCTECPACRVDADRLDRPGGDLGEPERHLQVPGRIAADEQPELGLDRVHDRLVHGAAAEPQRAGAHHVTAGQHRSLGVPAADVHDEAARPRREVEARADRGGDGLLDEPYRAAGAQRPDRGHQRPALHRGGATRHAHHGRRLHQPSAQAGLPEEGLQHGRGRVQVRDDAAPYRVDDLDVLRFLARQGVRGLADGRDAARRPVHGDGRRLLDRQPAAVDADKRVDGAQVNRYARPQTHGTCLCPKCQFAVPSMVTCARPTWLFGTVCHVHDLRGPVDLPSALF